MGSCIAYWISTRGTEVTLQDISNDALAHGMKTISALYADAIPNSSNDASPSALDGDPGSTIRHKSHSSLPRLR